MSWHESNVRTARKEYTCEFCGMRIEKGSQYVRPYGVSDGDFYDVQHHIDCEDARTKMCTECEYYQDCQYDVYECGWETGVVQKLRDKVEKAGSNVK